MSIVHLFGFTLEESAEPFPLTALQRGFAAATAAAATAAAAAAAAAADAPGSGPFVPSSPTQRVAARAAAAASDAVPLTEDDLITARLAFDDDVCDICRGGESLDGDVLLCCERCEVWVHQACYGVHSVPSGDW